MQANGSAFFGNTAQRVFGGRGSLARADELLELEASSQITYGDARLDGAAREVTKRVLLGALSLDYRPEESLSPFVFATIESNLEQQIAQRYSVGAGAKRTFVRTDRTEASLSAALLDERTVPRQTAAERATSRLSRWSIRGRVRHAFDERLRVSHVTFWLPTVRTASQYLVRSTSEAEYAMTRIVGVTASLVTTYDSEAVSRGARVNHDGQMLFGVAARW